MKLLLAATLFAANLGAALTPAAAVTIAENRAGAADSRFQFYWGQAFTTAAGGDWDQIVVNFYDRTNAPIAAGAGYLFAQAYAGTPGGLASAAALATTTGDGVHYSFAPGVRLAAATRYYFYADGAMRLLGGGSANGGDGDFYTQQPTGDFSPLQTTSTNFTVTGRLAAVPEPASWALMIAGFGMVGTSLRRRKVAAAA